MPSTTDTDGVSLSLSVVEVVDNFVLEENIVVITSDVGGTLWVCTEALELKYTNDSVFSRLASPCQYIRKALHGE